MTEALKADCRQIVEALEGLARGSQVFGTQK
jgi:hypothetical protein